MVVRSLSMNLLPGPQSALKYSEALLKICLWHLISRLLNLMAMSEEVGLLKRLFHVNTEPCDCLQNVLTFSFL